MWRLNGFWSWTSDSAPPAVTSGLWWGDAINIGEGIEIDDGGLEIPESITIISGLLLVVGIVLL